MKTRLLGNDRGFESDELLITKRSCKLGSNGVVVVAGLGEVGFPLLRILSGRFECVGVDIEPKEIEQPCSVMHVCYPFNVDDFIGTTVSYIMKYNPALTIINSTVSPGTTRKVQKAVGGNQLVAFSPVRGKHAKMESDLILYRKFVGAPVEKAAQFALDHFSQAGFKTARFRTPELGEISKLLETTYFGMLIAWAQEMERVAERYDSTFAEVNAFIEEIGFLPSHIFPGQIGGHCVMQNIAILQTELESKFVNLIVESNQLKQKQLLRAAVGVSK